MQVPDTRRLDQLLTRLQVLQQHNGLLEAHRQFLSDLKARSKGVPDADEVLAVCSSQLESMLENFEQCKSKFERAANCDVPLPRTQNGPESRTEQGVPRSGDGQRQTVDDSGFFMTDTRSTPIEELLRAQTRKGTDMPSRAKRKFVDEDAPSTQPQGNIGEARVLKKARISRGLSRKASRESLRNGGLPEDGPSEPFEDDEDSFVREVRERLAIEEQEKRKKADKKRKRDSGGSDVQHAQPAAPRDSAKAGKPERKKARTRNSANASGNSSSAPFTPLNQSRQPTPQLDRKNKRPSPASQYVDDLLRRAKRKKT